MTYLDDAVSEIEVRDSAAFLHVGETDVVDLSGRLDAGKYAERYYTQQSGYDGPFHTVIEELDDGYHAMIMEESQ